MFRTDFCLATAPNKSTPSCTSKSNIKQSQTQTIYFWIRLFDLRAIYVISATKTPERITIRSSFSFIFALKAIRFPYRLSWVQPIFSRNRLCVYPNTWVILLQIFAIKCAEKFFSLQSLQNICIPWNTSTNLVRSFPCWRPFAELRIFSTYRQD